MPAHYFRRAGVITRLADGACIPADDGNADYQRFLLETAENVSDPTFVADGYDPTVALAEVQMSALAECDEVSEQIRLQYVTPGFGQAQVYAAKLAQAEAWQSATSNDRKDLTKWPLIESEVDATGLQPAAAVAAIVGAAKSWIKAAAKIERIRLKCKKRIDAATTREEIMAELADALAKLRALDTRGAP